jgi:hypothetical protein
MKKRKIIFLLRKYSTDSAKFLIKEFIANILQIFDFKKEGKTPKISIMTFSHCSAIEYFNAIVLAFIEFQLMVANVKYCDRNLPDHAELLVNGASSIIH